MKIIGAILVGLWLGYIVGWETADHRCDVKLKSIDAAIKTLYAKQADLRRLQFDEGLKSLEKKADKIEGQIRDILSKQEDSHATK